MDEESVHSGIVIPAANGLFGCENNLTTSYSMSHMRYQPGIKKGAAAAAPPTNKM